MKLMYQMMIVFDWLISSFNQLDGFGGLLSYGVNEVWAVQS